MYCIVHDFDFFPDSQLHILSNLGYSIEKDSSRNLPDTHVFSIIRRSIEHLHLFLSLIVSIGIGITTSTSKWASGKYVQADFYTR